MRETLQQCFEAIDLCRKGKRDPNKENKTPPESRIPDPVLSGCDPEWIRVEYLYL